MRKYFYQPDRAAKINKTLESTNCPGKPKAKKYQRIEADVLGTGKYCGNDGQVTAFVWLDEDLA